MGSDDSGSQPNPYQSPHSNRTAPAAKTSVRWALVASVAAIGVPLSAKSWLSVKSLLPGMVSTAVVILLVHVAMRISAESEGHGVRKLSGKKARVALTTALLAIPLALASFACFCCVCTTGGTIAFFATYPSEKWIQLSSGYSDAIWVGVCMLVAIAVAVKLELRRERRLQQDARQANT
jgi:hypothetical protein